MSTWTAPQPVNLVDLSFMDTRFKLIEVAAFLDRVQKAGQDGDFRVQQLKQALQCLAGDEPERAKSVLLAFSDPTTEPIAKAHMQGAMGAYRSEDKRLEDTRQKT
ncbi:MAG: hypothetical protein JWO89_1117 [Verrucomicrobiaceae bacterium]|nr:hypothetical protein [Verrucomicrobiaceae bacterium]